MKPVVIWPGEGETLSIGESATVAFKVQGAEAGGALSITENRLSPGFVGPKRHFHRLTVDMFYVLEGTVTFLIGDNLIEAPAGSFMLAPPGVVHTFSNPGDSPARMLNIQTPAGLEQYLKEVAAEATSGALDPARMAAIAAKYDFVLAE